MTAINNIDNKMISGNIVVNDVNENNYAPVLEIETDTPGYNKDRFIEDEVGEECVEINDMDENMYQNMNMIELEMDNVHEEEERNRTLDGTMKLTKCKHTTNDDNLMKELETDHYEVNQPPLEYMYGYSDDEKAEHLRKGDKYLMSELQFSMEKKSELKVFGYIRRMKNTITLSNNIPFGVINIIVEYVSVRFEEVSKYIENVINDNHLNKYDDKYIINIIKKKKSKDFLLLPRIQLFLKKTE
eukprot:279570_1